jgi:hypothetical protein
MKPSCLVLAAAGFAASSAQAQLVEPSNAPQLQRPTQAQDQAFARSFQPMPRPYIRNEDVISDAKLFSEYRVDPKLKAGLDLNPYFSIETGYQDLFTRGFHYAYPGSPSELEGALGSYGSAGYAAVKLTVPVDDRLTAYGKLGIAGTRRLLHDSLTTSVWEGDIGPYAHLGAKYKLNDKAAVSAQYEKFGDSAKKFGNASNASGTSTKLNLGF